VADGRGFDEATLLVDEDYSGTLVRDGLIVYRQYDKARHQTCIAHLLRRCQEMTTELPDWAKSTPREVEEILLDASTHETCLKRQRRRVAADLVERIELIGEQARPPRRQPAAGQTSHQRSRSLCQRRSYSLMGIDHLDEDFGEARSHEPPAGEHFAFPGP